MIYMFLANGFEEVEALCPLDILRRAGLEVTTVGIGGDSIVGSHGIRVQADIPDVLYHDASPDMIILPGGMPGSTNLDKAECVEKYIKLALENDKLICAICAAPFILGKRGILKDKRATCFPGFENQLEGATVVDAGVVRDGNIITGRAMGSAHEFALTVLEALQGKEAADKMRRTIIL